MRYAHFKYDRPYSPNAVEGRSAAARSARRIATVRGDRDRTGEGSWKLANKKRWGIVDRAQKAVNYF